MHSTSEQNANIWLVCFFLISDSSAATCTVCLLVHVLCRPTHFLFQLFIATMSKQVSIVLRNIGSINTTHWVPPQGHIQGQTPVVYIFRLISCLKGFTLFYHILHKGGMHMSLEITKK